jgi:hypothetical protein
MHWITLGFLNASTFLERAHRFFPMHETLLFFLFNLGVLGFVLLQATLHILE